VQQFCVCPLPSYASAKLFGAVCVLHNQIPNIIRLDGLNEKVRLRLILRAKCRPERSQVAVIVHGRVASRRCILADIIMVGTLLKKIGPAILFGLPRRLKIRHRLLTAPSITAIMGALRDARRDRPEPRLGVARLGMA